MKQIFDPLNLLEKASKDDLQNAYNAYDWTIGAEYEYIMYPLNKGAFYMEYKCSSSVFMVINPINCTYIDITRYFDEDDSFIKNPNNLTLAHPRMQNGEWYKFSPGLDTEIKYLKDTLYRDKKHGDAFGQEVIKRDGSDKKFFELIRNIEESVRFRILFETYGDLFEKYCEIIKTSPTSPLNNYLIGGIGLSDVKFEVEKIKRTVDPERRLLDHSIPDQLKLSFDYHQDSSIVRETPGDQPVEVVSPPFDLDSFFRTLPIMLGHIQKIGYTNNSCGLHINISIPNINLEENLDILKLILFLDTGAIYKNFESRKTSSYAENMLEALKSKIKELKNDRDNIYGDRRKKWMLEDPSILAMFIPISHYMGIDLKKLKKNYLEFRYMGGKGYEFKEKEIGVIIRRYMYAMQVALDPQAQREEYILKINRLVRLLDEPNQIEDQLSRFKRKKQDNELYKAFVPLKRNKS